MSMHLISILLVVFYLTHTHGDLMRQQQQALIRSKRQFPSRHNTPIMASPGGGGGGGDVMMFRPTVLFEPFIHNLNEGDGDGEGEGVLELPEDLDLNHMDLNSLSLVNSIDNITAFAHLFGISLPHDKTSQMDFGPISRSGNVISVAENLEFAKCKPEIRTVELELPTEPNTLFYPSCVRLERCGGCCHGSLLTCRPTLTKGVTVKVMKLVTAVSNRNTGAVERSADGNINNGRRNRRRGRGRRTRRENIPSYYEVEAVKHVQCECGCKVQEQDCDPTIHNYMEGECACVCKRRDEKLKCEEQNSIKYWDRDTCECYCRRHLDCATGEYFNQDSCRCEREVSRSFEGNPNRRLRPQRVELRRNNAGDTDSVSLSSSRYMLRDMMRFL